MWMFRQLHGILDVIILCILIARSAIIIDDYKSYSFKHQIQSNACFVNLTRAYEVACTKIASVGDLANCFGLVSLTMDW